MKTRPVLLMTALALTLAPLAACSGDDGGGDADAGMADGAIDGGSAADDAGCLCSDTTSCCDGCDPINEGQPCDDGLFCNGTEVCSEGECASSSDPPCNGGECSEQAGGTCCDAETDQACGSEGGLWSVDACGNEIELLDPCDGDNQQCGDGACGCAPGWLGEACDRKCVIFVNAAGGSNRNGGISWDDAVASVQIGLDLADAGGGCEVWVAAGSYYPTVDGSGDASPDDARTRTLTLRAGVSLYCGFAGNEAQRSERKPEDNPTILTGDIGIAGDESDNAYHVLTGVDSAVVDGCIVTGGNANGPGDHSVGAGMFNKETSPEVRNCTFRQNNAATGGGMANQAGAAPLVEACLFEANTATSGAGMFNQAASPEVKDSRFVDNLAEGEGGGMKNGERADPLITGCTFAGNRAVKGGGMANTFSEPRIVDCLFEGNGIAEPGAVRILGGAIFNEQAQPIVADTIFRANEVKDRGGGIFNRDAYGAIRDCTFEENAATEGGAIYNLRSSPAIRGSSFQRNDCGTGGRGAGIYNGESRPTIVDCRFEVNQAHEGAGIFNQDSAPKLVNGLFERNAALFRGGAIFNRNSPILLINQSLGNNSAEYGSAVYNYSTGQDATVMRNSIVWGNTNTSASGEQIALEGDAELDVDDNSCVQDAPSETCDPAWDSALVIDDAGSGCIDAADGTVAPHTDIDGKCRGNDPDVGCVEFGAEQCDREPICGSATEWSPDNGGAGQKYWFCSKLALAWDEAAAYCKLLDGHLAAIGSGNEHMFIQTVINSEAWMGARHSEQGWTWVDGSPFSDSEDDVFWNKGVNLDAPRECGAIAVTNEWNDGDCDMLKAFVCEWEAL